MRGTTTTLRTLGAQVIMIACLVLVFGRAADAQHTDRAFLSNGILFLADPADEVEDDPGLLADYAAATFLLPLTVEEAVDILTRTNTFADDAISFSGSLSTQVYAFNVLLSAPDAARLFAGLLSDGTTAGRLYGLSGLYLVDRRTFEQVHARECNSDKTRTFQGCIVDSQSAARICESIRNGELPTRFRAAQSIVNSLQEGREIDG